MKKLILTFLAVVLMAYPALALPVLDSGYSLSNAAYWTPTDLTTASNGSIFSLIFSENASYESDFGLYTVNDYVNPTTVLDTFEIFNYTHEPGTMQSIYFKYDASVWSISNDNATWTAFDNRFGFYFGVHNGGASDPTADYTYYSDSKFNTPASEADIDHILIAFNNIDNIKLYLDDQISRLPADRDFNDMVVVVNDVRPVPEPGTLLLLGSGLIGLAFLKRRKQG